MPERNNRIFFSLLRARRERPATIAIVLLALALIFAGCVGSEKGMAPAVKLPMELAPMRADLTLIPLTSLNSPRDDFGLTMPLDTTLAFFTTNRSGAPGIHSIFWARREATGWRKPAPAVEVNNAQSNGVPSIAPNGETMYFAGCDYGFGDCDIYEVASGVRGGVDKETVAWGIPGNMGIYINSLYWDSQPCVSSDGSILLFASDRPGGFGGRDIWISLRNQDGSWNRPINAGPDINTAYDEVTPSITPDCRTLFFASNGHPGIGGFDLFSVELNPETAIAPSSPAINLGRPINSTSDDIALTFSSDGKKSFISSNRAGGLGGYDIYELSRPPVDIEPMGIVYGEVRDENERPLFARIEVSNLTTGNVIGRFQTNPENGTYAIVLRRGEDYAITAQAPGRLFHSQQITLPPTIPSNQEFITDHTLQQITGWTRLLLFFAPNSSNLERESTIDLDNMVGFLKANPDVRIELGGHTDNSGDSAANEQISLERAEAVKAYLVGNRIKSDRIEVKGYGDSNPIADNNTEQGRAMNRRVEMRVMN